MQTAARLDFIGLPRLRGCGGSVFFVGKKIGAAVVCVDEVGLGARLWTALLVGLIPLGVAIAGFICVRKRRNR